MRRDTLHPVAEKREQIAIRLRGDVLNEVRQLAEQETESNVSQMIRMLVSEALAARRTPVEPVRRPKQPPSSTQRSDTP